ncbi:hypothetical protein EL22_28645 [Halostagnicola sp. A56]|nr:hypothetical protein EL22_28645 [Halostagnicola sp. A56]
MGAWVDVMTYENLDAKLVNALLGDGRASLRSLAEELDVSVTTVSNHLSDLEEQDAFIPPYCVNTQPNPDMPFKYE